MSGETELNKLLQTLEAQCSAEDYVFVSVEPEALGINLGDIYGLFREKEGTSLVLSRKVAERFGCDYDGVFHCISLSVHSSLEAVGLTAAISTALAKDGISANVVAAFYHDHIFVNSDKSQQALECLRRLSTLSEE